AFRPTLSRATEIASRSSLRSTTFPHQVKFDDLFGTSAAIDPFNFNSQNGMRKDDNGRLCQALRGRVNELEAELAEQSHLRLQAAGESEFLRVELDDLRRAREDTEKEQRSLTEIESEAVFIYIHQSTDTLSKQNHLTSVSSFLMLLANEQRYTKLKEKYTELVQSHADLLRKNAEVTRQVTVARAAHDEVEAVRREMQEKERDQVKQLQELQTELVSTQAELDSLKTTMASSQQVSLSRFFLPQPCPGSD
ncbi:hypothetical protein GOODEAATRI_023921, partial [Goodea atripinnis]